MTDKSPPEPSRPVLFTMLWPRLVVVARECGYALGLHGSMVRDLDVMAMPWTPAATDVETLVNMLCDRCGLRRDAVTDLSQDKPHGRLSFLLLWDAHCIVDLSVMPPMKKLTIKDLVGGRRLKTSRKVIEYVEKKDDFPRKAMEYPKKYDLPITQHNYPHLLVYNGWFYWWTSAEDSWWASQNLEESEVGKIGPFKTRKLLKVDIDRRKNEA